MRARGYCDVRQLVAVPGIPWLVHTLTTLCRFDHKTMAEPKTGPFIPSQRRLGYMEILEIQGRDFMTSF